MNENQKYWAQQAINFLVKALDPGGSIMVRQGSKTEEECSLWAVTEASVVISNLKRSLEES